MNNNSTSKTQELVGVSPGTRGLTRINSWAPQHERRKSIRLLGKVVELDEWLDWRVKWGQRVTVVSAVLGVFFHIINYSFFGGILVFLVAVVLCSVGAIIGLGTLYFKNFSLVIARRLLKEVNVVMIVFLAICNFVIDCAKPDTSFSPINGFVFLVSTNLFVFADALRKKNRMFILAVGSIYALLSFWLVCSRIFLKTEVGVILYQYGDDYVFHKRSIKRSCFIQILLFSLNGMWTMFKDKKMEMMMFATGNIYRETGTASKYVEDREHSQRMRSETAALMV